MTAPLLSTIPKAAEAMGLSPDQVRGLLREGRLAYVLVGKTKHITPAAIQRFIESNETCQGEIMDRACNSLTNVDAITSGGPKTADRASVARAQAALKKLRSLSRNGSKTTPETQTGHVIQMSAR